MAAPVSIPIYGRLAGAQSIGEDPRIDPRALAALRACGLDAFLSDGKDHHNRDLEAIHAGCAAAEAAYTTQLLPLAPPPRDDVTSERRRLADARSGVAVDVIVVQPKNRAAEGNNGGRAPLPAIVQLHGGG